MTDSDKLKISKMVSKLSNTSLYSVIGSTLKEKGITSKELADMMRESGYGSNIFGNNILNAIQDAERGYNVVTIKDLEAVVSDLTAIAELIKIIEK